MTQATDFVYSVKAVGVNLERTNALNYGFHKSAAPWQKLKDQFCAGSVRMFAPFSVARNFGMPHGTSIPTAGDIAPYLDAVGWGTSLGIPTTLEFLDVSDLGDWNGGNKPRLLDYLGMCAHETAQRNFNPTLAAFGACNEWAAEANATWQGLVNDTAMLFADALPAFNIIINAGGWGGIGNYGTGQDMFRKPPNLPARRTIAQMHDYDANGDQPGHWAGLAQRMQAWCDANEGCAWRIGEAGLNGVSSDSSYNPSRWSKVIRAMASGAPNAAPAVWALTDGNSYPLNPRGSGAIQDALVPAFRDAAAVVAAHAHPPGPPDPTPAPVPAPPVPPLPPIPAGSTITVSDPGTIVGDAQGVNAAFVARVTTTPPLPDINIVAVSGADHKFYDNATGFTKLTLQADGTGLFPIVLRAGGDFLKYGVGGNYKDTGPVVITSSTLPPTPTIPPPVDPSVIKLAAAAKTLRDMRNTLDVVRLALSDAIIKAEKPS